MRKKWEVVPRWRTSIELVWKVEGGEGRTCGVEEGEEGAGEDFVGNVSESSGSGG